MTREDIIASVQRVDAFGVGGAIANAPVIDFGMDIVEIEGEPKAKRGKRSGVKQVYELPGGEHQVLPLSKKAPAGGKPLLEPFIKNGIDREGLRYAGGTAEGAGKITRSPSSINLPFFRHLSNKIDNVDKRTYREEVSWDPSAILRSGKERKVWLFPGI